jgi:hypothetical protein
MSFSFSSTSLKNLYDEIVDRKLLMPDFQRRFEWDQNKILALLDSIAKGISVGSLRVWDSGDYEVNTKNFGDLNGGKSDSNKYVLDGQQRLTTIYYLFQNASKCKNIYLNTDSLNEFYSDTEGRYSVRLFVKFPAKASIPSRFVLLSDLLNEKLDMDNLHHRVVRNLSKFYSDFMNFQIQLDTMKVTPAQASIIFERINTTSKPLSMLQIMVARCSLSVSLVEKFQELKEAIKSDLSDRINFNQCDPLKLLVDITGNDLRRNSILELDPDYIKKQWDIVRTAYINGIAFLDKNGIDKGNLTNKPILIVVSKFFFIEEYEDLNEMTDYQRKNLSKLIKETEQEKIQMSSTDYTKNLMIAVQDICDQKFTKTEDYMKSTKLSK